MPIWVSRMINFAQNLARKSGCHTAYGRRMAAVWLGAILLATPAAATNLQELVTGCEEYVFSGNLVPSFDALAQDYPQPSLHYNFETVYAPTDTPMFLMLRSNDEPDDAIRSCDAVWAGRLGTDDVVAMVLQFAELLGSKSYTAVPETLPHYIKVWVERCEGPYHLLGGAGSDTGMDFMMFFAGTNLPNALCQKEAR